MPRIFLLLGLLALAYAFLAGLRTVSDSDLGWQMATGRWFVEHRQIPSVDVLSYTAQGRPWIYPVGGELFFYGAYLLGGYALISWIGAVACCGTVALLLRKGSAVSAGIAILAVPLIAYRTAPRADMFTAVLFAAFLSLLWENYQTGRARLWLLPLLMVAWVNLHPGFLAGVALMVAYAGLELSEAIAGRARRQAALQCLRRASRWLFLTAIATLANPWGWGIYRGLIREGRANAQQHFWIGEWHSIRLTWDAISSASTLRQTGGAIYLLLAIALVAALVALLRAQVGAALLLLGATVPAVRYLRMGGVFACVVVVIGGSVLSSALSGWASRVKPVRARAYVEAAVVVLFAALAVLRSFDLITNRHYFRGTDESSFGAGLGWWFPERAAEFIVREKLPGEIFNAYGHGGYLTWALGPDRRDYIDGRAIPFGVDRMRRAGELLASSPDSSVWQEEVARYSINAVILPLARYDGISFVRLPDFCESKRWKLVYLDEVSAVFVRRTPQNEELVQRFPAECATAPMPAQPPGNSRAEAFNTWANAASVLATLGRNSEALEANSKALSIFPDSSFLHWNRGDLLFAMGKLGESEQEYLTAVALDPNEDAWGALARSYRKRGRYPAAVSAMRHQTRLSLRPYLPLLDLGYFYVDLHQPDEALKTFDEAARKAPKGISPEDTGFFDSTVAEGRAAAWIELGDLKKATAYQEEGAGLASPDSPEPWVRLAKLYKLDGRAEDASRAEEQAARATENRDRKTRD